MARFEASDEISSVGEGAVEDAIAAAREHLDDVTNNGPVGCDSIDEEVDIVTKKREREMYKGGTRNAQKAGRRWLKDLPCCASCISSLGT